MSDNLAKAEKLYYEAVESLTRAKPEEALVKLNEAASLSPNDPLIFEALGVTYKILDDPAKALEAFKTVLLLNPELLSAYRQMVQIYLRMEEEDQALELLIKWEKVARKMMEVDDQDLDAIRSLAECLFTMDEIDEAVTLFNRIIENIPEDLDSYLGLADIYFETGAYEEIEPLCKQALERFPDNASLRLTLGLSYNYRNLIAKAIQELTIAHDLNPDLKELPGLIEKLSELKITLGKTVEEIIAESSISDFRAGFISWYDDEEGIGFIRTDEDEEDFLLHFSALTDPDYIPRKGEKVRFGSVDYPQGKLAVQVSKFDQESTMKGKKLAKISALDRDKGFGIIEYEGENLLFFISHVREEDKDFIEAGDTVIFSISETTDLDDKLIKRATEISKVSI
ncbi:MAG: tetratricopeptide repeat protein [bacterium]|jgi:tetratricopeptide (TPR) repeat protein|nr:tetratricopeptide repeat protein [bacterium]